MASLVVKVGRNEGAEFKLNAERVSLGRRSICDIPIADPKASREHAEIIKQSDGTFLLKNRSINGSLVNGRRIGADDELALRFGDRLRIGDTEFELFDESRDSLDLDIPGYKILDRIGRGGMGTVYKARQLSMDRIVALKVLEEKHSADREFVDRFIREARAAGKMNHPNVIHVHDVSRAGNRHYFSMEYVDGFTVKELLRRDKIFTVEKAADVAMQSAKALEFAHENGIVHRDIKPDNLMVTRDGIVKLADLGIAKVFADNPGRDHRRIMGTPHYMAPEQALGKSVDHRSDIYSLGATFYQMLTGQTPFSGATSRDVLKAHIQESLAPIQTLNKNVSDPVCFIIERMMAKMPEQRYPSMTALIADLEKVQQGLGDDIQRLQAGASSIMSSVNDADPAAAISVRRRATEDIGTGIRLPIGKWISSAVWTILLCAVVSAGVWAYMNRETLFNEQTVVVRQGPTPPDGGDGPAQTSDVASANQPLVMLKQARELLADDALSPRAEDLLRKIADSFPAAPEAEPAKHLLTQLETEKKKIKSAKLATLLKEAKTFETEQPTAHEEIIKRYRQIVAEAGDATYEAAAEAQRALREIERRRADEQARTVEAVFATAKNKAEAALKERDFDGAAAVWREFLARHGASNKRAEADYEARRAEEASDKAYAELEERALAAEKRTTAGGWAAALKLWDDWLDSVKAQKHRGAVETARKTLADRAEKFYAEESAKLSERARLYQYDWALEYVRGVAEKLTDTEWGKKIAELEDRLNRYKQLHRNVLDAIAAKVKESGAVPLPFDFVIPRMEMIKQWAICGAGPDRLELEAVPKSAGPGVSRKFADLTPEQQYQAYRLFLPAQLTPELEKALAAFCEDRGLTPDGKPKR